MKPTDWCLLGCKPQADEIVKYMCDQGNEPSFVVIPPDCPLTDANRLVEICQKRSIPHEFLTNRSDVYLIPMSQVVVTCRFFVLNIANFKTKGSVFYNIHSSLLPRWAGIHPVQWAIISGDSHTGVTIHKIANKIDGGEILNQQQISIDVNDTFDDVQTKIDKATPGLLYRTLNREMAGVLEKNKFCRTWAPRRKPQDSLFTWDIEGWGLHNLVRAMTAPALAYYEQNGNKKFVKKSSLIEGSAESKGSRLRKITKVDALQWRLEYEDMTLQITLEHDHDLRKDISSSRPCK